MISEDTIGEMFWNRVRQYGPGAALRVKRDAVWQDISWEEWGERKALRHGPDGARTEGERESGSPEREPAEWAYVDLAVLSANAVDTPIYATNIPEQVEHIVKDSDPVHRRFDGTAAGEGPRDQGQRSGPREGDPDRPGSGASGGLDSYVCRGSGTRRGQGRWGCL